VGGRPAGRGIAPHFPADVESPVDFMLMVGRCAPATDKNLARRVHGRIAIIYLRRRRRAIL